VEQGFSAVDVLRQIEAGNPGVVDHNLKHDALQEKGAEAPGFKGPAKAIRQERV